MKVCDEPGVQHEMFTEIKIEFPRVSIWEGSYWKKIFASNAAALDVHCFPLLWNSDMKNQLSPFVKIFSFGCLVVFNIANRLIPCLDPAYFFMPTSYTDHLLLVSALKRSLWQLGSAPDHCSSPWQVLNDELSGLTSYPILHDTRTVLPVSRRYPCIWPWNGADSWGQSAPDNRKKYQIQRTQTIKD